VPALAEALLIARGKSRVACRERAEAQWSHALMLKRYEKLLYEVMAAHAEQQRGNRSAAPAMPARAQLGGHNG
jgi:hypothetical protein